MTDETEIYAFIAFLENAWRTTLVSCGGLLASEAWSAVRSILGRSIEADARKASIDDLKVICDIRQNPPSVAANNMVRARVEFRSRCGHRYVVNLDSGKPAYVLFVS